MWLSSRRSPQIERNFELCSLRSKDLGSLTERASQGSVTARDLGNWVLVLYATKLLRVQLCHKTMFRKALHIDRIRQSPKTQHGLFSCLIPRRRLAVPTTADKTC